MLRVNAGNIRIARFKILTSFKKFANSREHILSHSKQRYSEDSKRGFFLSCPVSAIKSLELSHKWTADNEYLIKSIFVHFSGIFIFPARNKFNL